MPKYRIDYYYTNASGDDLYEIERNVGIIFNDWRHVKTCNGIQEAKEFIEKIKNLPEYYE